MPRLAFLLMRYYLGTLSRVFNAIAFMCILSKYLVITVNMCLFVKYSEYR